jgi:hypothetical protein
MMRLAVAVWALALAAAHPAPHASPPHASPRPQHARAGPPRIVRAVIVSGNGQTAHAYIAGAVKRYDAEFANPLVVRVPAPLPRDGKRYVRFTCVTKGCTFAPTDQPENGKFVERVANVENEYKVEIHRGAFALRVTTEMPTATGTRTVRATPVVYEGERAVTVTFELTSR